MKRWIGALAGIALVASVFAQDLKDRVEDALDKPTPAEVIAQLEKEDQFGNVLATYQLGLIYKEGKLVPQDFAKALGYFEEAGDDWVARYKYKLGVPQAQYEAGILLLQGAEGVERNAADAADWLQRAAEQGDAKAQLALAELLASDSPPTDMKQAFFWASLAQNQFDLSAEEKEKAVAILAKLSPIIGAGEAERIKTEAANWSPRRML
jgi:TPR repeat protein